MSFIGSKRPDLSESEGSSSRPPQRRKIEIGREENHGTNERKSQNTPADLQMSPQTSDLSFRSRSWSEDTSSTIAHKNEGSLPDASSAPKRPSSRHSGANSLAELTQLGSQLIKDENENERRRNDFITSAQNLIQSLASDKEALSSKVKKLERELRVVRSEKDAEIAALKADRARMESELTRLKHDNEDLREEMNVMGTSIPSAAVPLPRPSSSPSLPLPGGSSSCQRVTVNQDRHGGSDELSALQRSHTPKSPIEVDKFDEEITPDVDDSTSNVKTTKTQKSNSQRGPAVHCKQKAKALDSGEESSELSSLYDESSESSEEHPQSRTTPSQAARESSVEPRLTRSARREQRVRDKADGRGRVPRIVGFANYFVQKGEDTVKIPRERFTEIQKSAMFDIEKKFSCERVVKNEWYWCESMEEWIPGYQAPHDLPLSEIWKEYIIGRDGGLSIKELNEGWGSSWQWECPEQTQIIKQRKIFVDLVESVAAKPGWNADRALAFFDYRLSVTAKEEHLRDASTFLRWLSKQGNVDRVLRQVNSFTTV